MSDGQNVWRSLEKDFRAIHDDQFFPLQADYHERETDPDGWSGWSLRPGRVADHFRAIAILAGQALWDDKSLRPILPEKVILELDPLARWLTAVCRMTGGLELGPTGYEANDDGTQGSRLMYGHVPHVIEKSALLCLQLAASMKVVAPASEADGEELVKPGLEDVPKRRGRIANTKIDKRKEITKTIMKTREHWKDPGKIKALFETQKEKGSPIPQRRNRPADESPEAWDKALKNSDARRRVCSDLRRECYSRKSKKGIHFEAINRGEFKPHSSLK